MADRLALIAIVLAAVAGAAGLFVPHLYRDTAEGIRQARATDLVTLLVAVPALAIGLWRAVAGSTGGRLVALAALGYFAYSYATYAFSVVIDPLTPVHIAILGLATWSLVLTVFRLNDETIDRASRSQLLRRTTGVVLIAVAGLFVVLWLSQIVGAITSGRLPSAVSDLGLPTSPVYSLDLAFAVPLIAVAGVSADHHRVLAGLASPPRPRLDRNLTASALLPSDGRLRGRPRFGSRTWRRLIQSAQTAADLEHRLT